MNYKIVNINTSLFSDPKSSILIIYTGGTFGMLLDENGALAPFNFSMVIDKIPDIKSLDLKITVISFPTPEDSSNIGIKHWSDIGYIIYENYEQYDGIVVLHGTDTMAYSASALSFMLDGVNKPIIFTGAQIPIGFIRSDARENLITALEIASSKIDGLPIVNEVCIYFNYVLLRGNRAQKLRSSNFAAFESENYPKLAESGVSIDFNFPALTSHNPNAKISIKKEFDNNVALLKLFPGISENMVKSIFAIKGLRGVVMETFGSGNTMSHIWFLKILEKAVAKGIIIFNVSQCIGGKVLQGRYETSTKLGQLGVISGSDITTEAAMTKMMFLLGSNLSTKQVKSMLVKPLKGEMS